MTSQADIAVAVEATILNALKLTLSPEARHKLRLGLLRCIGEAVGAHETQRMFTHHERDLYKAPHDGR